MLACPVPTDSILRRHFEQLASTAGLQPPPEESVLLRHYMQLLDARLAAGSTARGGHGADAATSAPFARASAPKQGAAPSAAASVAAEPAPARPTAASREAATAPSPHGETAPRAPQHAAPSASTGWFGRLMARLFGN